MDLWTITKMDINDNKEINVNFLFYASNIREFMTSTALYSVILEACYAIVYNTLFETATRFLTSIWY